MMYGGSAEDAAQNTSTSYPFYVELESSEGLLLGQHVYIEQDNGLEEREEGIWLDEAFLVDANRALCVGRNRQGNAGKKNRCVGNT